MQDVTLDPLPEFNCPLCGMSLDASDEDSFYRYQCPQCGFTGTVPGKFGQFHLLEKQGESITSVLFDAFDPKLGRHVSLKILNVILSKNSALVESFKKEALAAASLNSLYVLKVYEFGVHNRQPYMVMERIEGRFLNEILEDGPLPQREAIDLVAGIVQGLHDMHHQGIVHGDVMPRNILVHTDGTPRISDFGLARFDGEQGQHLQSWSSPYYMPPERIRNQPEDFRGDFYSLGTTLFYMLTGQLPFFDLEEEVVLERKLAEPAPDPRGMGADIHEAVAQLVGLLLHRSPEDRPASFDELKEAIEDVSEFLPRRERRTSPQRTPELPQKPRKKNRREPMIWFVFLTLAGILATMLLAVFTGGEPEPAPEPTPEPTPVSAMPTPAPSPTPAPTPTPTPTPLPTPTPKPTPVPITLNRLAEGQLLLLPPDSPSGPLAEWRHGGDVVFQQAQLKRRPVLLAGEGTAPLLAFESHHMVSALTPHWQEEFTLVLVLQETTDDIHDTSQMVLGVHPHESGWTPFGIFAEAALPGGFTFRTDRGTARLNLPLTRRDTPFVLAFRRTVHDQEAFLAGRITTLPDMPVPDPGMPPEHIESLQLGGTPDPKLDFDGKIGALFLADRALSDDELAVVIREFRNMYQIQP